MQMIRVCFTNCYPLDKRRKLNVHNTLRGYPECFLGCCSKYVAISGQKMMFSIKDFFSKWDQFHSSLRIWSHLLKKSLMEKFIFCAVYIGAFFSNYPLFSPYFV